MGVRLARIRRVALTAFADVRGLHPGRDGMDGGGLWSTWAPSSLGPWLTQWFSGGAGGGSFAPNQVETVGSASRCLQLVSQQISTMPLRYRHDPATQGTEPAWVASPDPIWFPGGIGETMFAAVWSIYAWGDAFLYVTGRYADGYPRSWTVLDPGQVNVEADPAGGRRYRVGHAQVWLNSDDVLQISRDPKGGLRGTSALSAYASNLTAASAAERFAGDFFLTNGVPWAVLQPQRGRVTSEVAAELQAQWVARASTRGAAPAVIPPDVTFHQFSFSPKDLLLLESREWDAKQIAAAFGVPAFLLNLPQADGLNYSNPEQLFTTWVRTELYPTARRIEACLSVWMPRGNWVEFDPSYLLRPDFETWAKTWVLLLDKGVVTIDETRAAVLDLPPVAAGEALALIDEPPGAGLPTLEPTPTIAELEALVA